MKRHADFWDFLNTIIIIMPQLHVNVIFSQLSYYLHISFIAVIQQQSKSSVLNYATANCYDSDGKFVFLYFVL